MCKFEKHKKKVTVYFYIENKPVDTMYCIQAECPPVTIDRAAELHSNTDKIITAQPFDNTINNYEWRFTGYGDCSAQCLGGTNWISSGGSKGGARDAPPLWPKISSFSCSFREKLAK